MQRWKDQTHDYCASENIFCIRASIYIFCQKKNMWEKCAIKWKIPVNLKVLAVVDFILRLRFSFRSPPLFLSLIHDIFTSKSCNLITDNHHQNCQWDEFRMRAWARRRFADNRLKVSEQPKVINIKWDDNRLNRKWLWLRQRHQEIFIGQLRRKRVHKLNLHTHMVG